MTSQGPQPETREPPGPLEVFRNTLADLMDTPAHMLVGLRFSEDAARQLTGDQWVVELFQNARDALVKRGKAGARVRVVIAEDAVLVANDGARFDRAGYEAVTGIARSGKGDRKPGGGAGPLVPGAARMMGRHGIGFKSVLQATDRPQIFANTPGGERFAIEAGSPRVPALCAALAGGDEAACLAQLGPEEQAVFREELTAPLTLEHRSLVRHLGRRGVGLEELLARLPALPFPLWVDRTPAAVASLLGWDTANAGDPFDTVVRVPLRSSDADRVRAHLRSELQPARRVFLGIHVKIEIEDKQAQT